MILSEDFEDFLRLLNEHEVDYLVVGGYAMAFPWKAKIYWRFRHLDRYFSPKCSKDDVSRK